MTPADANVPDRACCTYVEPELRLLVAMAMRLTSPRPDSRDGALGEVTDR